MSRLSRMPSSNGGVAERSTSAAPVAPADRLVEPKSSVLSVLNEALHVLDELDLETGTDSEQLSLLKQRLAEERLSATPDQCAESTVQQDLAEAIPSLFERELGTTAADFTDYVARSLEPHWRRLETLIETVRKNAARLFDIPYRPLNVANAFVLGEEPYWETHAWQSRLAPIPPEWVDRFLPARVRRARIAKRLMQQVDRLVMHNVERLRWPTLQSLDATFRRFGQELEDRFQETIAATQGAIEAAVRRHQDHTEIAAGELARLTAAAQRLRHIIAGLVGSDV